MHNPMTFILRHCRSNKIAGRGLLKVCLIEFILLFTPLFNYLTTTKQKQHKTKTVIQSVLYIGNYPKQWGIKKTECTRPTLIECPLLILPLCGDQEREVGVSCGSQCSRPCRQTRNGQFVLHKFLSILI